MLLGGAVVSCLTTLLIAGALHPLFVYVWVHRVGRVQVPALALVLLPSYIAHRRYGPGRSGLTTASFRFVYWTTTVLMGTATGIMVALSLSRGFLEAPPDYFWPAVLSWVAIVLLVLMAVDGIVRALGRRGGCSADDRVLAVRYRRGGQPRPWGRRLPEDEYLDDTRRSVSPLGGGGRGLGFGGVRHRPGPCRGCHQGRWPCSPSSSPSSGGPRHRGRVHRVR